MALLPWRNNPNLNHELQSLIQKMEQLRSKAEDIKGQLRNEELQPSKKRKSEVMLWLNRAEKTIEDVESIKAEVLAVKKRGSRVLLNEMKGMMEHVDRLLKQGEFSQGLVLDDLQPEGIELVTEKLEGSTPLTVKDKVRSAFRRGESRVGIFGMGGVGKTSAAMHINNEILAGGDDFKHVYYVTVSRDSSVHKLQGDISRALQLQLRTEDHETRRAAKLQMSLKKREKSLLILDDIWENIHLEKVGVAMECDGCKLLITTRKRSVCRRMNCSTIVEMRPLLDKEAWDLFVGKLGNYEQLSDEAKRIARSICKECSGLPLAIIKMAGCMRGEFDEHVWREMLRQLKNPCSNQDDMDSEVFSKLKLSYERLNNDKLRECLLYCAMYPEDHKIPRDDLIKCFIAVGLGIDEDGSTRKEHIDKGHSNLNVLESASLLECVTDFDGVRCVKMHDLIRDMALKIIGRKGMVKAFKGLKEIPRKDEWTKDLVRVSLMENDIEDIGDHICPECPNLSVLILCNNPLQHISQSFFAHMAGLRCLDLSYTSIVKLPNSIANLCNLGALLLNGCVYLQIIPSLAGLAKLRDLNVSGTKIQELPEGVEELINLKYLDLSRTEIQELPEVFEELINLEYLDLHRTKIQKLPKGVEELINPEHLDVSKTRIQNTPDGLFCRLCKLGCFLSNSKISILAKELTSLRQLSRFAGWVADFDAFKQFVGSDCFHQLERYYFHVGGPDEFEFSFKSCDRRIIIRDCQLSIRREVCSKVPHNVEILELVGCSFGVECLLEALPSLCAATELERCLLASCKGIKYIVSDACFDGGGYQPLKGVRQLGLVRLDDFVGLYEGRSVHPHIFFGGLKDLRIEGCPSVKKIWLQNDVLPNLESIQVEECNNMAELFSATEGESIELPCLKSILVWNLSELKSISRNNVLLPCLDDVVVGCCPKLEMLWSVKDETTITWANFWRLVLTGLPELKSIWGNGV